MQRKTWKPTITFIVLLNGNDSRIIWFRGNVSHKSHIPNSQEHSCNIREVNISRQHELDLDHWQNISVVNYARLQPSQVHCHLRRQRWGMKTLMKINKNQSVRVSQKLKVTRGQWLVVTSCSLWLLFYVHNGKSGEFRKLLAGKCWYLEGNFVFL